MRAKFLPCGDCAVTVNFGNEINRQTNRRVTEFTAAAEGAKIPGAVEYIPAFCSVTVIYDPLKTTQKELIRALKKAQKNGAGKTILSLCFIKSPFAMTVNLRRICKAWKRSQSFQKKRS